MKASRILACLSAVCMLTGTVSAMPAGAATVFDGEETETTGTIGDNLTWTLSADGHTLTISGTGEMTENYADMKEPEWGRNLRTLVIEEGVTTISAYAFYRNISLSSVSLPDSLTEIGTLSFAHCSYRLKEITLPPNLKKIGVEAFEHCEKLETLTVPDSVTEIGRNAFEYCNSLTSLRLPAGLEVIEAGLCSQCTALREVYIPDGVKKIGGMAFFYCLSLESADIPDSVTFIGDCAFDSCTALQSLHIPDGLTHIGCRAFKISQSPSGSSLNNRDALENWIGPEAFLDCSLLTSYTVSADVQTVSENAFRNCANLQSLTFLNPDCEIFDSGTTVSSAEGDDARFTGVIYGYADSTAQKYAEKYGYTFAEIGTEPPQELLRGDPDGDGKITAKDAAFAMQAAVEILVGNEPEATAEQLKVIDVDGDGEISALDAQYVLLYFLENTVMSVPTDWDDIIQH